MTARPNDTGRKDSLGRTIRTGDTAAEHRSDAPAPGMWQRTSPPLARIRMAAINSSMMALTHDGSRREFDVNAPYQRNSVWTDQQRRDLIRSILLGVPIGTIIRSNRDTRYPGPMFRVVDGKQRIEAIWSFIDDNLDVPADWFPTVDVDPAAVDSDGMVRWSGLSKQGRRGFENLTISITEFTPDLEWIEVEPGTGTHGNTLQYTVRERDEDEILEFEAMVFGLINSAGTPQTDDTIANAARIAAGDH